MALASSSSSSSSHCDNLPPRDGNERERLFVASAGLKSSWWPDLLAQGRKIRHTHTCTNQPASSRSANLQRFSPGQTRPRGSISASFPPCVCVCACVTTKRSSRRKTFPSCCLLSLFLCGREWVCAARARRGDYDGADERESELSRRELFLLPRRGRRELNEAPRRTKDVKPLSHPFELWCAHLNILLVLQGRIVQF